MVLRVKCFKLHKLCQTYLRRTYLRRISTSSCLPYKAKISDIQLSQFTPEKIRNFGIIAHVDHGKSTLADRLLEVTGTISTSSKNKQVLDSLQVEKERGITVKAQTASVVYEDEGNKYLLNFIDTPGHVDFSYEVSRSLVACQGVLLVVDATQGIQAQTLANFYLAMEHNIEVIPVINKIDLKTAKVDTVLKEMSAVFGINPDDAILVSAKVGTNVDAVLKAIVKELPSPVERDPKSYSSSAALKMLLFDSIFEPHKGVTAYVAVLDGIIKTGDDISSHFLQNREDGGKKAYNIQEVGLLRPLREKTGVLYPGQIGYVICGMKNTSEAQIGDTLFHNKQNVEALPGFSKAKPVVFAGMFPRIPSNFENLKNAINKLTLHDRSVTVEYADTPILGRGFRIGYLGLLHMDIFRQRLEQEFKVDPVMTFPNVPFKARIKPTKLNGLKKVQEIKITKPSMFPNTSEVLEFLQPMINATIIAPIKYNAAIMKHCSACNGKLIENTFISDAQSLIVYKMPSCEVLVDDFYDTLKSLTSGYASFDYEETSYETTNLQKIDFMLNGKVVEELSRVCTDDKVYQLAKSLCLKIKETLPFQSYQIIIQAVVGSKIICRETKSGMKIDVLAKCYGGDYSRKLKLLKRHAEKQKTLRETRSQDISKDVYIKLLQQ